MIADRAVALGPDLWTAGDTTPGLTHLETGGTTVTIVAAHLTAADAALPGAETATIGVTLTDAVTVTATTAGTTGVKNGVMANVKLGDATKTEACPLLEAEVAATPLAIAKSPRMPIEVGPDLTRKTLATAKLSVTATTKTTVPKAQ